MTFYEEIEPFLKDHTVLEYESRKEAERQLGAIPFEKVYQTAPDGFILSMRTLMFVPTSVDIDELSALADKIFREKMEKLISLTQLREHIEQKDTPQKERDRIYNAIQAVG